jgi:6-phosphogluconolactonase
MPELRVFANSDAVVETAAREIALLQTDATFHLVLAGGSTPEALYRRLASSSFDRLHVWFGDERCVAPDHPDSNYGMASRAWTHALPQDRVHRMRGELAPDEAALLYANEMRRVFGDTAWPRFDLVLLGVGEDGHTASLFPGTTATDETEKWVAANHVPKLDAWRLTLTFPVLNAAKRIWIFAVGPKKAEIVRDVLGARDVARWPVQGVQPTNGEIVWWLDDAAGAMVTG